tara:strand:- start:836 stop:1498 length:663 start_codon:yes stop_codon:yes gene_type:complete
MTTPTLNECITTISGRPKIGKSTFASGFPNAVFAATEAGLNFLDVTEVQVREWPAFKALIDELTRSPGHVETLVIDTLDNLHMMCEEHVCQVNGISHPSDLGYGKGFTMVKNQFRLALTKASMLQTKDGKRMGLVMISHAKEMEVESRTGKVVQWTLSLPNAARQIVEAMSDLLLFADVEGDTRVLRTKPHRNWVAGDRSGKLPATIELSYDVLKKQLEG